jgi:glycerophosphoryl diester phosphodiesterase
MEIIAHRGFHNEWPENSLRAAQAAIDSGADAIEVDVHATRDGVVMVNHDPVVQVGPGRDARLISASLHAELARVKLADGSEIPRLADMLELCSGKVRVYVEIKGRGMEAAVLRTIGASSCQASVHSFDHRIIRRCGELAPAVRRGILLESYLIDNISALRNAGALDLWQYHELVDESLVQLVHQFGGRVVAWTVNDTGGAEQLASAGVDAICSDDVAAMVKAVGGA